VTSIIPAGAIGAAIPIHNTNPKWLDPTTAGSFLESKFQAARDAGCGDWFMLICEHESDGVFNWKLIPDHGFQMDAIVTACELYEVRAHVAPRNLDETRIWPDSDRGREIIDEMREFAWFTGCAWFTLDDTGHIADADYPAFINAWLKAAVHTGLRIGPEPSLFLEGYPQIPQMTRCQKMLSMEHQQHLTAAGSDDMPQIILVRPPRGNDPDPFNRWPTIEEINRWREKCLIAAQGEEAYALCKQAKDAQP
jgi:hypothetical protein